MRKILIVLLLSTVITCGIPALTACWETAGDDPLPTESGTAEAGSSLPEGLFPGPDETVLVTGTPVWNGYIVGMAGSLQDGGSQIILKFNAATGTLTPACLDPLCGHGGPMHLTGGCPLNGVNEVIGIRDNRLYYFRRTGERVDADDPRVQLVTSRNTLTSYDLTDGTVKEYWVDEHVREMRKNDPAYTPNDAEQVPDAFMYGDYIFIHRYSPTCDSPTEIGDYAEWLVCMNADTGVFTQLVNLTERNIDFRDILFVRDGRVYHLDSLYNICELDVTAQTDRVLLSTSDPEMPRCGLFAGFVDGWMWYEVTSPDMEGISIRRMNVTDGTVDVIVPDTHGCREDTFTVCDGKIYVMRKEDKSSDFGVCEHSIVRYDMDGRNETVVATLESVIPGNLVPCGDKLYVQSIWTHCSWVLDIPSGTFTRVEPYREGVPAEEGNMP